MDRRARRDAGRAAPPPARPARGARGGRPGARPPRAVHRRRDADRAGERGRRAGRGRHRPAGPRPAREREERDAIARARIHVQRLRGAAQEGGPVERACEPSGRPSWPGPAAATTPSCGRRRRRSGRRSSGRTRPRVTTFNQAEALIEAGERAAAARAGARGAGAGPQLGSRWLVEELTALAERARLDLAEATGGGQGQRRRRARRPEEDPFGLTPASARCSR